MHYQVAYCISTMLRTHTKPSALKVIHKCCLQGYFTSWVENERLERCLVKYFSRSEEKAWSKEIEVLREISKNGEHDNLLTYRWHSEGE